MTRSIVGVGFALFLAACSGADEGTPEPRRLPAKDTSFSDAFAAVANDCGSFGTRVNAETPYTSTREPIVDLGNAAVISIHQVPASTPTGWSPLVLPMLVDPGAGLTVQRSASGDKVEGCDAAFRLFVDAGTTRPDGRKIEQRTELVLDFPDLPPVKNREEVVTAATPAASDGVASAARARLVVEHRLRSGSDHDASFEVVRRQEIPLEIECETPFAIRQFTELMPDETRRARHQSMDYCTSFYDSEVSCVAMWAVPRGDQCRVLARSVTFDAIAGQHARFALRGTLAKDVRGEVSSPYVLTIDRMQIE
jgi:hypothetical protein